MELTLKRLLEDAEFKKFRGKGYDPGEVDEFLKRASAMANKVEAQLTQAMDDAKSANGPSSGEIEAEVERRVADRVAEAPPVPSEDEHAEEMRRTLVMAQRTADAAVAEAREDAAKIVAAATEQSDTMVADATQQSETMLADATERSESLNQETAARAASATEDLDQEMNDKRRKARTRLADEIADLEGIREALRSDVNLLERHVEEQRSQLGSTLAELQRVLDDPAGFRLAPAPALNEPDLPDFSDLREPEPTEPVAETGDDAEAEAPAPEADAADEADSAGANDASDTSDSSETAESAPEAAGDDEAGADPSPSPDANGNDASAGEEGVPQPLAFGGIDHAAPGVDDAGIAGPPTAPVSAVDLGVERPPSTGGPKMDEDTDDAFLTELRKAMADDEPLGPRDDDGVPLDPAMFDDSDERRGRRFGRRR